MNPAAALRSEAAAHILERLGRGLDTAIAVRWYGDGREGPVIAAREADPAVAKWYGDPATEAAVSLARLETALQCVRLGTARSFLDLFGLAHACAAFGGPSDKGFCLVAGPFCPLEGIEALETDIRAGMARQGLDGEDDAVTTALTALPFVPIETGLLLAEWAAEALDRLLAAHAEGGAHPGDEPPGLPHVPAPWEPATPKAAPYDADMLGTALAAGDSARLRALLRAEAAETEGRVRVRQRAARARVLATLAAGLEAAERAGLSTTTAWSRMPQALAEVQGGADAEVWVNAAMRVFGAIARKKPRQPRPDPTVAVLDAWLETHLPEGVSLGTAAAALGEHPTAITHRLQRKFGLSFSQYVNRLRLDRAKTLLRTTKLPLAAVAARVGVGDPSNLGRIFRTYERMSPGEYRKRFGKNSGRA